MWASNVLAENSVCADGDGSMFKGIDGTNYCRSRIMMNWWSAFAWCDTIGGVLIDPNKDCKCKGIDGCDMLLSCPNLKEVPDTAWTSSVVTPKVAYFIYDGTLTYSYVDGKYGPKYALCRMP